MRIFVAGATGVLGMRVVPLLVADGHEVRALARTPEAAASLREQGAEPVPADLFDPASLEPAVDRVDAVVNLATRIPDVNRMMLPGAWRENDRIRTDGVRTLVAAADRAGVPRFVQESITFLYADGGDDWLTEDAPLEPAGVIASARTAERTVARFESQGVVLRFATLVAPESPHARDLVVAARRGFVPLISSAEQFEAFVHADDAAAAVVASLGAPPGVYNVSEDEPALKGEHAAALGQAIGREVRLPPRLVGKLPRMSLRDRSWRVSNRRLRDATGWRPTHTRLADEWASVVADVDTHQGANA